MRERKPVAAADVLSSSPVPGASYRTVAELAVDARPAELVFAEPRLAVAAVSTLAAAAVEEPAADRRVPAFGPAPVAFDIPAADRPAEVAAEAAVAVAAAFRHHPHLFLEAGRPGAFPVPEALRRAGYRRRVLYLD